MAFYRFGLPLPLGGVGAREGTWHAVLEVDAKLWKRYLPRDDVSHGQGTGPHPQGARYNLSFHTYSNLRMQARLDQSSLEPGALFTLRGTLTEYDVPLTGRATVVARVERPDHSHATLPMAEVEPGTFEATLTAGLSGLYRARVEASGKSRRGRPFTREQLMTAAVFRGGNGPLPDDNDLGRGDENWCQLAHCILSQESVRKFMAEFGIDPEAIWKCVDGYCRRGFPAAGEGSGRPRVTAELADRLVKLLDEASVQGLTAHLREALAKNRD